MRRQVSVLLVLALSLVVVVSEVIASAVPDGPSPLTGPQIIQSAAPSVASILAGENNQTLAGTASAVIIDPRGVLVTAYHVVKGKRALQVRLENGEVYDQVEIIGVDERRDIAVLRIPAVALPALPVGKTEELQVGETVYVVSTPQRLDWTSSQGILSAVRRAEEVPGAGEGYRLLQFTAPVSPGSSGGALLDSQGRVVGVVIASAWGQNNNFAVPLDSVMGLVRAHAGVVLESGRELYLPRDLRNPPPVEASDAQPGELLEDAKAVYICCQRNDFSTDNLAAELIKHPDFRALKLKLVNDKRIADLIIQVDHPLGFWDFSFTVFDQKTSIVLASGNVIAWDSIRAAPALAKKIMEGLKSTLVQVQPDLKRR